MKEYKVDSIDSISKVLYELPQDAKVVVEVGDFGPVVSYETANCFCFNEFEENELGLYSGEPENGILSVSQVISEIEKTSASKLILADNFSVECITQIDTKDELLSYLKRHLGEYHADFEYSEIMEVIKFPFVIIDV